MNRKLAAFVGLALILGAVFVRLGFWQLDRRMQRRAANAVVAGQLALPPAPIHDVTHAPRPENRRASVEGAPDYGNEFVVTGRSLNGSPGVHIFTPVRVAGRADAVLVNRGWVYSPDASTVDLARWRETRNRFTGYTQRLPEATVAIGVKGRGLRPLTRQGVARLIAYGVDPVYLVAQDSAGGSVPVRLPEPTLDEGPHLSYAIQWFAFATIALVGAALVVRRARQANPSGGT